MPLLQSHKDQANPFMTEDGKHTSLRHDLSWLFWWKKTHEIKFLLVTKPLRSYFSKTKFAENESIYTRKEHVCSVAQSCLILCDPMDCIPPVSSMHGILQARILEGVVISFPRVSSWLRDWTCVSWIVKQILYHLESPKEGFFTTWKAPRKEHTQATLLQLRRGTSNSGLVPTWKESAKNTVERLSANLCDLPHFSLSPRAVEKECSTRGRLWGQVTANFSASSIILRVLWWAGWTLRSLGKSEL